MPHRGQSMARSSFEIIFSKYVTSGVKLSQGCSSDLSGTWGDVTESSVPDVSSTRVLIFKGRNVGHLSPKDAEPYPRRMDAITS